jgi:hypothetical protein
VALIVLSLGLDALVSEDLLDQLESAIGDHLASAKFAVLRVKWEELLAMFKREGPAASGGSSGISSKAPAQGPPDSSGDEDLVDELGDDGEGAQVQKTRSSRRKPSPHMAKAAGKQKEPQEERPKRRRSKVNLKFFDEEVHQLREHPVCGFILLSAYRLIFRRSASVARSRVSTASS